MRVLVLGAGGFVGQAVMAGLESEGLAPVALTRSALDATDPAALRAELDGIDAVVNCVTGSARTLRDTAAALAASIGDRRIVQISSMAVYGTATGPVDETSPLRPDLGAYGAAKIAAEALLADANAVHLRPGCVFGPGGRLWTARIARLLAQGRIGDLGAAGAGNGNLIAVEDVASAVVAALRLPAPGVFNLASADTPDWNGYFAAFAKALNLPLRHVPGWRLALEGKLLAVPLKLAEMGGLHLPPPIAPSQLRLWRQDIRMDTSAACEVLGLRCARLEQTVARSAAWVAGRG